MRRKVDAGKRLLNLEWPRLACLCAHMTPVVQAERNVAVLLNFKHYDAASQGVDRSSRYEDGIAGLRRNVSELVRHSSVRDRLPQAPFRGTRPQTGIDAALRTHLQYDPGFGPSRSRPPAAGPYARPRDALGRRAFHVHPGTSGAKEIGGTVDRPPIISTGCFSIN